MGDRIVALLPMKAHSERVPGKNFREFCGKPLFRWILDSLLSIRQIDCIVINTDARENLGQKGLAESSRVMIRDRKLELCGDMVSMNLILADDIAHVPADVYLMTHVTNPLLSPATIKDALEKFLQRSKEGPVDSLFTVTRRQARFYRADGSAVNHDPANLVRTQDLEPWFEENSNLYIFTGASFAKTKGRIGAHPLMHETAQLESIDIDTEADWRLAEVISSYRRSPAKVTE